MMWFYRLAFVFILAATAGASNQTWDDNCDVMEANMAASRCISNIQGRGQMSELTCRSVIQWYDDGGADCFLTKLPLECPVLRSRLMDSMESQYQFCKELLKCQDVDRAIRSFSECQPGSDTQPTCGTLRSLRVCYTDRMSVCRPAAVALVEALDHSIALCDQTTAGAGACLNIEEKTTRLQTCMNKLEDAYTQATTCRQLQEVLNCSQAVTAECPYLKEQVKTALKDMAALCNINPDNPEQSTPATPATQCIMDNYQKINECLKPVLEAVQASTSPGGSFTISFKAICNALKPRKESIQLCMQNVGKNCPQAERSYLTESAEQMFQFCDEAESCPAFSAVERNLIECTKMMGQMTNVCSGVERAYSCMIEAAKPCPAILAMMYKSYSSEAAQQQIKSICPNIQIPTPPPDSVEDCATIDMNQEESIKQMNNCTRQFWEDVGQQLSSLVVVCSAYEKLHKCVKTMAGVCKGDQEKALRLVEWPSIQTKCQGCPGIAAKASRLNTCFRNTDLKIYVPRLRNGGDNDRQQTCNQLQIMADCAASSTTGCPSLAKETETKFLSMEQAAKRACGLNLQFQIQPTTTQGPGPASGAAMSLISVTLATFAQLLHIILR